jgi:hypothetical protein
VLTATCKTCGVTFETWPSYLKRRPGGPFCSLDCASEASRLHPTCRSCGKPFTASRHRPRQFCSRDCFQQNRQIRLDARYLLDRCEVSPEGCWLWTGLFNNGGYGSFRITSTGQRLTILAHRAAYEVFVGKIPDTMLVCHRCDTPSCINPEHLFLGTHSANTRDAIAKGRQPQCTKGYRSQTGARAK